MKKNVLIVLMLLSLSISVVFAANNVCTIFSKGNGLSVFVTSKEDPNDKDLSVQDYINTITITSNGNKMRIIDCQIRHGKKWESVTQPLGEIIEPYGKYTFPYKTSFRGLKRDDIEVTAEGCK